MQSTNRSRTFATSDSGSLIPSPTSELLRNIHVPPICLTPTSKLTRVLREGFSNNKATVLFTNTCGGKSAFIKSAFFTKSRTPKGSKSWTVKKSLPINKLSPDCYQVLIRPFPIRIEQ